MVVWTDQERSFINGIFANCDYEEIGSKSLIRCLIVYPWCLRYFSKFDDITSNEAIKTNKKIAAHGVKVLHGLDLALKNMDNIKAAYSKLSVLHSETLHVDPDNFRVLSDCITIEISAKLGSAFTPEMQAALQKFLCVVVSALGKQYH